jgi:signal peptidase I
MRTPGREPIAALVAVLSVLLVAGWSATEFLARPWTVAGESMAPGLRSGDRVLVDLWSFRQRPPRVGEVVLFRAPVAGAPVMVKRVARVDGGTRLWLLGDNLDNSSDSRAWGRVDASRVVGRVALRYWPPSRFGAISSAEPRPGGFRLPVR